MQCYYTGGNLNETFSIHSWYLYIFVDVVSQAQDVLKKIISLFFIEIHQEPFLMDLVLQQEEIRT